VPSVLRGFSAPVKIDIDLTDAERCFLMGHDSDAFNRWEAGQQLAIKLVLQLIEDRRAGRLWRLDAGFSDALRKTLRSEVLDAAMIAQVMMLPSESYVAEFMSPIDPQAIHEALLFMRRSLAEVLQQELQHAYETNLDNGPYSTDADAIGRRSLKNVCLGYLMELQQQEIVQQCVRQFRTAGNMTDRMAALHALANSKGVEGAEALAAFYQEWRDDPLVMDKWLTLQATSRLPGTLATVQALTAHPVFNIKNPNKVRSLIGAFCSANPVRFHAADGAAYAYAGDFILRLDPINPQVTARLVAAFSQWRRYDAARQGLMRAQLQRILAVPGLSRDVYEIVSKSLADSAV
jgi:aminopeptidase N